MREAHAKSFSLASYLEPLKDGKVPLEILMRGKDTEENKQLFERCLDTIKNAGVELDFFY